MINKVNILTIHKRNSIRGCIRPVDAFVTVWYINTWLRWRRLITESIMRSFARGADKIIWSCGNL